ncbi:MAG: hypothetical protein HUJ78_00625 [Mogibacterium sp.]|nr:hypothetical protein [Mogibacterium sp.]MCF0144919.1 hypothetical protein [Bacillota bacterium]
MERVIDNKVYDFEWGLQPDTTIQRFEGAKAARCNEDDKAYWIFYKDGDDDLSEPTGILEMTESEEKELEYKEVIDAIRLANKHGEYPEVSQATYELIVEITMRKDTVFALCTRKEYVESEKKGLAYLVSRKAIEYARSGMEPHVAIGKAMQEI